MPENKKHDSRSSAVFDAYATYYDLLYQDKDYASEAAYIHSLLQRYAPQARTVLELGCGTGGHAFELTRYGYHITGVDLSDAMVQRAQARAAKDLQGSRLRFVRGDLRDYRDEQTYDAVLALFHVMSYQTSNADIASAIATAKAHLAEGGVFIFDCWYGPGVLTDLPVTRVRRLRGEGVLITRIAEPRLFPNDNRVDVHYEVLVEGSAGAERIHEVHPMRYLFVPEVQVYLQTARMNLLTARTWMSECEPGLGTWNVCFVTG